jgi:hypothetical protein
LDCIVSLPILEFYFNSVAVTKGLVDLHFGKISVSSEGEGRGCTFTVEVPLHVVGSDVLISALDNILELESSRILEEATEEIELASQLHILVVDDATSNRKMLVRLLENRGHSCVVAEDGVEGVMKYRASITEARSFDVILMDYQMPEMDGPAAIRVIRDEGFRGFIIGLTGNIANIDKEAMLEAGADNVMDKPVNSSEFDKLISLRMRELIR